mmetsp:Transcript_29430/g.75374  ORF Transcript_29430/g.75374 Transcript_29430/m.75374 type:complete len:215 (+) Transcript_29430:441-1085(+)
MHRAHGHNGTQINHYCGIISLIHQTILHNGRRIHQVRGPSVVGNMRWAPKSHVAGIVARTAAGQRRIYRRMSPHFPAQNSPHLLPCCVRQTGCTPVTHSLQLQSSPVSSPLETQHPQLNAGRQAAAGPCCFPHSVGNTQQGCFRQLGEVQALRTNRQRIALHVEQLRTGDRSRRTDGDTIILKRTRGTPPTQDIPNTQRSACRGPKIKNRPPVI